MNLFDKSWEGLEEYFSFIWGVKSDQYWIINKENKDYYKSKEFIFNYILHTHSKWKKYIQHLFSFLLVLFFSSISILSTFLLFLLKKNLLESLTTVNKNSYAGIFDNAWPSSIAVFNCLQIRLMSLIFRYFSELIINYNSYDKQSDYEDSLFVQTISFEFVNHFNPFFYILFLKVNRLY